MKNRPKRRDLAQLVLRLAARLRRRRRHIAELERQIKELEEQLRYRAEMDRLWSIHQEGF